MTMKINKTKKKYLFFAGGPLLVNDVFGTWVGFPQIEIGATEYMQFNASSKIFLSSYARQFNFFS